MNLVQTLRRDIVSPSFLTELREKYIPLEYLEPRLYKNANRYQGLRRIQVNDTDKVIHETWVQKFIDQTSQDSFVTITIENENRLDIISYEYYETPRFWWVIALANNIIDPFDIPVGTTLRIPIIVSLYNEGGVLSGK